MVETILKHARTGDVGDGKIFVDPGRGGDPHPHRRGGRGGPPGAHRGGDPGLASESTRAGRADGPGPTDPDSDRLGNERRRTNGKLTTDHRPRTSCRRVEEDGVEFIRFWFTDILGQLKSFAVGREELEGALEEGMGFDGSSITGFNAIEESDMIAMPDPDTYAVLPWRTDGAQGQRRADVLRRPEARRRALRGRPALRHAPGARPRRGDGLRHLQHRPGARVLLLRVATSWARTGCRRSSTRAATST